jgi:hypothetical protein
MSRLKQFRQQLTEPAFYSEAYRNTIESCLSLLKVHHKTREVKLDPHKSRIYRYDFYTYLRHTVGINPEYHWIIMRLNDMLSPRDFDENVTQLLIPDESYLRQVQIQLNTTRVLDNY